MVAVSTLKRLSPRTRATVGFHSRLAEVVMVEAAAVAATVVEVTSMATMEAVAWVVVITR